MWLIPVGMFLLMFSILFLGIQGMLRHVRLVKAAFKEEEGHSFEALKIHFRKYDVLKRKTGALFSINSPLYNFAHCDLFIRGDALLLVGRGNGLMKRWGVNATVFYRGANAPASPFTKPIPLLDIQLTQQQLLLEFQPADFPHPIIAVIGISKQPEAWECMNNWRGRGEF
ncbi:MAG: hypothetical protein AAF399_04555 [Bacteroidota bacterium]